MLRKAFELLFKLRGWNLVARFPKDIKRCVMISAPHTSNIDFVYAIGAFEAMDMKVRFTIKKEWLRFPFNLFMEPLGAIPIDRSPKEGRKDRKSMVEAMTELFEDRDELIVIVTPEGTRKRVDEWKTGFYYVALNAGVPILCSHLDYPKREGGIGKILYPTGDIEKDMAEIMEYYEGIQAKYPEQFALDKRYYKPNKK